MSYSQKLYGKYPWLEQVSAKAKLVALPGFDDIPVWHIVQFVIQKIQADSLTVRARSVAFTFLLAIFPATIFLFSLIPYIPIPHLQDSLINVIREMTPKSIFTLMQKAILEAAAKHRGGILSFGFLSALIISTNGTMGLMDSFDKASEYSVRRSRLGMRLQAITLTVILFVLLLFSISLIVAGNKLIIYLFNDAHFFKGRFNVTIFTTLKYLVIMLLFFNSISIIYRYGPAHKKRWKFISPGSVFATFLSISVSIGFSFFVNKFGGPSRLFGSLGAIIALQIWIYLNSFALLLGFELNAAIEQKKFKVQSDLVLK